MARYDPPMRAAVLERKLRAAGFTHQRTKKHATWTHPSGERVTLVAQTKEYNRAQVRHAVEAIMRTKQTPAQPDHGYQYLALKGLSPNSKPGRLTATLDRIPGDLWALNLADAREIADIAYPEGDYRREFYFRWDPSTGTKWKCSRTVAGTPTKWEALPALPGKNDAPYTKALPTLDLSPTPLAMAAPTPTIEAPTVAAPATPPPVAETVPDVAAPATATADIGAVLAKIRESIAAAEAEVARATDKLAALRNAEAALTALEGVM